MRIRSLGDLEPQRGRTVVINAHTDLVTTRALLSAVELGGQPVLLVNCDPPAASSEHFDRLAERHGIDVLEAPLKLHGQTLDRLFTELRDERVLLLDSDAELRDPGLVRWMHDMLDHPKVFGAGFTQGPHRAPEHWPQPAGTVLYMERPWVPCTMLRGSHVKEALAAGRTFVPQFVPNDLGAGRRASNFLAARWGPPWAPHSQKFNALPEAVRRRAKSWRLDRLEPLRSSYYRVLRPSMAFYDTAADVHEHLRFERGLLYAGIPFELAGDRVHHYEGVSRYQLVGAMVDDTSPDAIHQELVDHLRNRYGYTWPGGGGA
ncbi:MAG: hypothetical protein ACLGI3_05775 [Actinomycetes bacterium]